MRRLFPGFLLLLVIAACGDDERLPPGNDPDASMLPPDAAGPGDPTTGAWRDGFELPGPSGLGSRVEDIELAPDGTVYVAGIFEDAAGVPVHNIAAWNGTDWVALGDGLDGWVQSIELDGDGVLWAAATSEDVTTATLAKWTGTAWIPAPPLDGAIRDLAVVSTGIAVVGDFTGSVRVYDPGDASWVDVTPSGITGAASAIEAIATGFCVAGSFDSIDGVAVENAACWNGSVWTPLGAGLPGGVAVLEQSPAGVWFAGGTLTFVIDPSTGEYEAGIARLVAGTWQPFQGGIDNGFINEVRAIAFDGTDVLVGGHFQTAGTTDVPASHLARFTPGTGWSEIGGGLANDIGVFLPSIVGTADIAIAADGSLWIGGLFTRAGGVPAVNATRIPTAGDPVALVGPHPVLGVGGFVDGLAATANSDLLAGGSFAFAGQTVIANLGALRGSTWGEVGGIGGIVRDMLELPDGTIAVVGDLFVNGGPAAYAEWDGASWNLPGGRVTGQAFALLRDAGGGIWIGGELAMAGTTPVSAVAHLSNATWTSGGVFDGRVTGLAFRGDELVAAGLFTMIDGVVAKSIAIRAVQSPVSAWAEIGGGLDGSFGYINCVFVSGGYTVIGGDFEGVGGAANTVDLARWDGTAWSGTGADFAVDDFGFVSALEPYDDGMFVAGGFREVGGVPASNIGWFDGTTWHAMGDGLADLAEALVVMDDVMYAGGPFTAAGGRPASGLAAWDFRN